MKVFIKYLYLQTIELDEILAFELLQLSDKYCVSQLTKTCEEFLIEALTIDNCIEMIIKADRFGLNELKENSLKFIVNNLKLLRERNLLEQLPKNILIEIINFISDK